MKKSKPRPGAEPVAPAPGPSAQALDLFRLLIDNIRDYALILLDPEGTVLSWHAGAERLKGWKADEIVGQHFSKFYPPEDVAKGKTEIELKTAREEGRFEDE